MQGSRLRPAEAAVEAPAQLHLVLISVFEASPCLAEHDGSAQSSLVLRSEAGCCVGVWTVRAAHLKIQT